MEDRHFNIHGHEYVLTTKLDSGGYPASCFKILGTDYEIRGQEDGRFRLYRCPHGACDPCSSDDFTSLKEATQFADLYERVISFTFETNETKETTIPRILDIVEDLRKTSGSRN